jgi:RNA-directed DNA polymerase
MKRVGYLWDDIISFENLLLAAEKARRGKRFKPGVARFFFHLERELVRLQEELGSMTYQPGPYRTFTIYEGKPRQISAAPFRDRVVHHALRRCAGIIVAFRSAKGRLFAYGMTTIAVSY